MLLKFLFLFVVLISVCGRTQAAIDAQHTRLITLQEVGPTNVPNGYVIQAYDDQNMPINTGGATFEATIDNGGSTGTITDNNDGTYSGSWSATNPGVYSLDIILVNPPPSAQIQGSPFEVTAFENCTYNDTSHTKSYAVGCGVQGTLFSTSCCVGQPAQFTVYARDHNNNFACSGGDNFTAVIRRPTLQVFSSFQLTDNGDGTYTGTYTPNILGIWQVHIKLDGTSLSMSPYLPLFL